MAKKGFSVTQASMDVETFCALPYVFVTNALMGMVPVRRIDDTILDMDNLGLDHHLDHRVGWVERSETQHFVFVGFRSSTQPTFHALAEIMIKATL